LPSSSVITVRRAIERFYIAPVVGFGLCILLGVNVKTTSTTTAAAAAATVLEVLKIGLQTNSHLHFRTTA
jgi:hypothetical protein